MYLSKWVLDKQCLLKNRIINDYVLHQKIFNLFPDTKDRCFLYSSKLSRGPMVTVLVQSETKPEKPLFGEYESKQIEDSFFEHKRYLFQCKFCPVKQISHSKKTIPIKNEEEVFKWLKSREENFGVLFHEETLLKNEDGSMIMRQKDNPSRIHIDYVEVTGVLDVKDVALFNRTIKNGIGRSKGFGLGMLQLRPIE